MVNLQMVLELSTSSQRRPFRTSLNETSPLEAKEPFLPPVSSRAHASVAHQDIRHTIKFGLYLGFRKVFLGDMPDIIYCILGSAGTQPFLCGMAGLPAIKLDSA
jgi:hypothetical protein